MKTPTPKDGRSGGMQLREFFLWLDHHFGGMAESAIRWMGVLGVLAAFYMAAVLSGGAIERVNLEKAAIVSVDGEQLGWPEGAYPVIFDDDDELLTQAREACAAINPNRDDWHVAITGREVLENRDRYEFRCVENWVLKQLQHCYASRTISICMGVFVSLFIPDGL